MAIMISTRHSFTNSEQLVLAICSASYEPTFSKQQRKLSKSFQLGGKLSQNTKLRFWDPQKHTFTRNDAFWRSDHKNWQSSLHVRNELV